MKSLCLILLCSLFYTFTAVASQRIRLTNGEWPPYLSANLPYYGHASHIISAAFAAVDVEVEYGFFPWKRSFLYAQEGKGLGNEVWNGSVVWVYTKERAEDFSYSDIVIADSEVFFFLKENPLNWQTLQDLQGKVIGATSHTVYPMLEDAEKQGIISLNRAKGYAALFKRLLAKRIDAIPNVKQVGDFFVRAGLASEKQSQITSSQTVIEERQYYLILSKKIVENEKLMTLFNKGLKLIKENGVYNKLQQDLYDGKYDIPYPIELE